MTKDSLGDFLKSEERKFNHMPEDSSFIYMRLDGRGFSKLTRGFEKPCDKMFMNNMHEVTELIMKEFQVDLAFHQSDEISLVWFPVEGLTERPFAGSFNKLTSLVASYASVQLAIKLQKECYFDARAVEMSHEDTMKMLWWRYKDCTKNAISMTASELFSETQLSGVSTRTRLELIQNNPLWIKSPDFFKTGFWLKKEKTENDRAIYVAKECPHYVFASDFFHWIEPKLL